MNELRSVIIKTLGYDPLKKTRKDEYVFSRAIFIIISTKKLMKDYKSISDFLGISRSSIYNYIDNVIPYVKSSRKESLQMVIDSFEGVEVDDDVDYKEMYYKLKCEMNGNDI
jgi:hypothetical protein